MADIDQIRSSVRKTREELRLGQAELASRAHVALSTLRAFEQGRLGEIGFSKLSRILGALGLELQVRPASGSRPTLDDLRNETADD